MGQNCGATRSCSCSDVARTETMQKMKKPKGKLHEGQIRSSLQVKHGGFAIGSLAATHPGKVEDSYELDKKKVGEGGFGSVRRARCRSTGKWRAVKSIARSAVPEAELLREEIDIMRLLDHPHIVRLSETFEDNCWVYIVMELCEGGELFNQIVQVHNFTEQTASSCTRQMLLSVNYLHQNLIMHRDLKPENFLLAADVPLEAATLKLIDFGFAKRMSPSKLCHTLCGTLLYIAPEVLDERYTEKADIWSIGVIAYLMLSGQLPWKNPKNDDLLMQEVKRGQVSMQKASWRDVSSEAKDLVNHLLTRDDADRPGSATALQHSWLAAEGEKASNKPCLPLGAVNHLKAFTQMNDLKKAAADVLVTQLPESEIRDLRTVFMNMDTNKDGTVSSAELRRGLARTGLTLPENLDNLMSACDLDGSGVLDYTEFLAATMGQKQYHQKDVVWAAFKRFDFDGTGFIDRQELANVLNEEVQQALHLKDDIPSRMDQIFAEVDTDHNNRIDFDEFFKMMNSVGSASQGPVPEDLPERKDRHLRTKRLKGSGAAGLAAS